jgi:hypothetical protein
MGPSTTRRTVTAAPVVDLRGTLEGWADPVAFGVGYDGALYVVAPRASVGPRTAPRDRTKSAKNTPAKGTDYLVVRADAEEVRSLVVLAEPLVVSYVQPIGARILLVDARCSWRRAGPEKNAVVLGWDDPTRDRLTLGDAIADVRVTADARIWASYIDEGVFGSRGWTSPGPTAIGAPGLVGFDASGEAELAYDAAAAGTEPICDAYAMNVGDDGAVWLYFYMAFPIVRFHRGAYRVWKLGAAGARAIAISQPRALLFGDYQERSLVRIIDLRADGFAQVVDEVLVTDVGGESLDGAFAYGRGAQLFFFKDRRVSMLDAW